MTVKGKVIKGRYFDSVSLMIVSKELNGTKGVVDSSVVMGTEENRKLLKAADLDLKEFEGTSDTDILISIRTENEPASVQAFLKVEELFKELQREKKPDAEKSVRSFEDGLKVLPDANLSLISVAGRYASAEAMKALKAGLHVMVFSDNVPIGEEVKMKQYAHKNNLLLMGPDCGSSILNGIPLGFANVVKKGKVGIVAASGTGLQEVSCVIANHEAGVSQAIGTGGRDLRKEVGGIMFLDALKALGKDPETEVIVLISKPPHPDVLKKISDPLKKCSKKVVAVLLGGDPELLKSKGAIPAATLEEAGLLAAAISEGHKIASIRKSLSARKRELAKLAGKLAPGRNGKYLRGLYSGGTLCDETQLVLKDIIGNVYGNSPLREDYRLKDLWKSTENCVIDLGEDEFTQGRPHPMIDYSLRCKRILEEASDPDVAVILLDVVLGYGSHMDPASELTPVIQTCITAHGTLFIGSVTGTDEDPQDRKKTVTELEKAGMIIMPSNVAASELAGMVVKEIAKKKS